MNREGYGWHSPRLGREMRVLVYGHYGLPLMVFPTSTADEREFEDRQMVEAIAHHIDAGKLKVFCVNTVNADSWYNEQAHPAHRSWLQSQYDGYIAQEVAPFIQDHCRTPGIGITTTGASFGAYHALNSVLKHPETFRRCVAMSGVYDLRKFMHGHYDDNFYFNNPVDYVPNLNDPWYLHHLSQSDIHLVTGHGAYEDAGPSYRMSGILAARGIPHVVDNWGPDGGHDWPYWKKMIDVYVGRMF